MHNNNCPESLGIIVYGSFEKFDMLVCILALYVEVYEEHVVIGVVVVCGSGSNAIFGAEVGEIVMISVEYSVVVSRTVGGSYRDL